MKKKQIIIIVLFLFALLTTGVVYNYLFNGKHRNIADEAASISISANKLHANFLENESLATTHYLDVVLETSGKVTSVEQRDVVLDNRIQVKFEADANLILKKGQNVLIKGRCVGYDELLEVVKIDQATLIK